MTCTMRVVLSQNTCLCTLTFGMANTPLPVVTCDPVLFEVKTTYFYYIFISFIIFIFFLNGFYLILIVLVVVPAGSGWFLCFTYICEN